MAQLIETIEHCADIILYLACQSWRNLILGVGKGILLFQSFQADDRNSAMAVTQQESPSHSMI